MSGITDYFSSSQSSNELEQMCGGMQLTRMQRFYAFGACFAIGTVISMCSTLLFMNGQARGFAILYTVGNLIALMGTGFLTGFLNQFKRMFDSTRIIATCVFLVSMITTITVAVVTEVNAIVIFLLCIIQYLALFWYSMSYIPFARDAIIKGCTGCVSS